jgi:hypothetical protein
VGVQLGSAGGPSPVWHLNRSVQTQAVSAPRIEHLKPTGATVRELYFHAFTCARSDCKESLHKPGAGELCSTAACRTSMLGARAARDGNRA